MDRVDYWLAVTEENAVVFGSADRDLVNDHINDALAEGHPLLRLRGVRVVMPAPVLQPAPSVLAQAKPNQCPRCHGAGRVPTNLGRPEDCPDCNGGQKWD